MVILLTGASKGIGFETTRLLCKEHTVIAISRTPINFVHPNLVFIQGNINCSETIEKCKNYLHQHQLALDVLINNAGYLINKPFESINKSELLEVYETNVFAPFIWIQELLPFLKKSPVAHIVNISSMGGITGTQKFTGLSAYSSSKGALSILTECLAEELKPYSVSCNALALGAVQTDMLTQAFPNYKAPVSADTISKFIVWFALNGKKFFNGKTLPVSITTP